MCRRLRKHGLKGSVVQIHLRSNDLTSFERQLKLDTPTDISGEVCKVAMELLTKNYNFTLPLRSVGVRVTQLCNSDCPVQLSFFTDSIHKAKMEKIEQTKDAINDKFGRYSICRAVILSDKTLFPEYDPSAVTSCFKSH